MSTVIEPFWVDLCMEAIGALIGAFAGFSLALWNDRRKLRREKEEMRRLVARSLLEETQDNLSSLRVSPLATLRTASYSSAKITGRLDVFNFNILRQVEDVYMSIEQLNKWIDIHNNFQFSSARALSSFPEDAKKIFEFIRAGRIQLETSMKEFEQNLKQEAKLASD